MIHERIDPHLEKTIMRLSRLAHIKRYQKAAEIIGTKKRVLDAGCGYGYGSEILAKRNTHVCGVDKSVETIEYADANYKHENIDFYQGDIGNFDFSEFEKFDAITFFEVLEHLINPSRAIENLRKALNSSGKLIIFVPNGRNSPDNNGHHLDNYTPEDLEKFLYSNGFEVKQKIGQYPLLGTLAGIAKMITGYQSCTNKESGIVPKLIDSVPCLPEIFSNLYESKLAVSTGRTIYFVAELRK